MIAGILAGGRPLTADAIPASDPHFANVVLLMHMDGTNGSTSFSDVKGNPVTTGGGTQLSTSFSKFGAASGYFDGNGDYLFLADRPEWHFPGDFTVEMWLRPTNVSPVSSYAIISQSAGGAEEATMGIGSLGRPYAINGSGVTVSATSPLVVNAWQHYACVKRSGTLTHYIDGVASGSGPWTPTDQTSGLYIGAYYYSGGFLAGRYYTGYIDELRITKGVARYTANFTPPTAAFPNS